MGVISTSELLEAYEKSVEGTFAEIAVKNFNNSKLYDYEKKVGKELIDMSIDDLFGLILEYKNKRKGKEIEFMTSFSSFDQLSTLLRAIFNFYIDNYQLIKNPLNDKRMKGREAVKRLAQGKKTFRWEDVQNIINMLHKDFDKDYADYLELVLLLFYNGFSKAEDIVTFKADMLNHYYRIVNFENRTVRLSDRCYELLMKFNKMDKIAGWRGNYILASWNDSFFKFIIRPSQKDKLNERPKVAMCEIINRLIATKINNKYETKINYRLIYMLGFYEYIIAKHGEEKTNEMIMSYRNSDDVDELMNLAKEYGVVVDNVTHLKRYLRPFIVVDNEE